MGEYWNNVPKKNWPTKREMTVIPSTHDEFYTEIFPSTLACSHSFRMNMPPTTRASQFCPFSDSTPATLGAHSGQRHQELTYLSNFNHQCWNSDHDYLFYFSLFLIHLFFNPIWIFILGHCIFLLVYQFLLISV